MVQLSPLLQRCAAFPPKKIREAVATGMVYWHRPSAPKSPTDGRATINIEDAEEPLPRLKNPYMKHCPVLSQCSLSISFSRAPDPCILGADHSLCRRPKQLWKHLMAQGCPSGASLRRVLGQMLVLGSTGNTLRLQDFVWVLPRPFVGLKRRLQGGSKWLRLVLGEGCLSCSEST